jgi:hypothetical protein
LRSSLRQPTDKPPIISDHGGEIFDAATTNLLGDTKNEALFPVDASSQSSTILFTQPRPAAISAAAFEKSSAQ